MHSAVPFCAWLERECRHAYSNTTRANTHSHSLWEMQDAVDTKKEDIVAATLAALGEKLDADNEAKLVSGRALVADGHAKALLETATRHRDEVRSLCEERAGRAGRVAKARSRGVRGGLRARMHLAVGNG